MKLISQGSILELSRLHIMGILNITPDSFFDGGKYKNLSDAIEHVNSMINAGATIVDVGGESTRPGAKEISTEEELNRVIPVIENIAKRFEIWISVNTSKPEVIRESARAGAHIINDVRSLSELGALEAIVETNLPVCLMHMQGNPKTMQNSPKYIDIFVEINNFFSKQIKRCKNIGIAKEKLILDPGFGFGKNINHNYKLLAYLSNFHNFNLPLMVGMSRKSMIGQLINAKPSECLIGSLACALIAAMQGVHIIRVHDVKETAEVIRIVEAILSARGYKYYE